MKCKRRIGYQALSRLTKPTVTLSFVELVALAAMSMLIERPIDMLGSWAGNVASEMSIYLPNKIPFSLILKIASTFALLLPELVLAALSPTIITAFLPSSSL